MNFLYLLKRAASRGYWLKFSKLRKDVKSPPHVSRHCEFGCAKNIYLGNRVQFLRGSTILADEKGKIIIDDDSAICRFAILQSFGGIIRIGKRTFIGDFANLYGYSGGLTIGNSVLIASGCVVIPSAHGFQNPSQPIMEQPNSSRGISIGDGSWIGANVSILDNVRIGQGAVIGAGAVVNHDVADFAIVAGVPAKLLRFRPGFDPSEKLVERNNK